MDKAQLFALLPYPFKKLAAAARGLYLERWRYDASTENRVAAAQEREGWSTDRWSAYREEMLVRLLVHAAREVPFYREQWTQRRRQGDRSPIEDLQSWPLLEKEALRASPRAFLADSARGQRLFPESTSGSSGTPISLFWDLETSLSWYALFEARCRRWHGLRRGDRWAILGGQMIVPARRDRPPFWVYNAAMQQLYLSSNHLSPTSIPHFLKALREHEVTYLYGYSSALDTLASSGEGHHDLGLRAVISNAEPLYQHQRERITTAFGCPVRETYGMAELVAAASECPAGRLHLWPEVGIAELEPDGGGEPGPAEPGAEGNLIATGLLNFAQPLVRYRVGDRLRFGRDEGPCACGRSLPWLTAIDGRSDDVVITRDGRLLGRLDPIFKGGLPIREAQIVQETQDRLRLRLVPAPGFGPDTEAELRRRFLQRVGDLEVVLEKVERLERGRNGKLKGVISLLREGNRTDRTDRTDPTDRRTNPAENGILLSVILPVRNEEAYLERCLEALLRQNIPDDRLQVLVVDGRSSDRTRELAEEILSARPGLAWLILDNPGRTAPCAMNIGLDAARGTFIARVDGHCELGPRYFEQAFSLLAQHPRAAGVAGRLETVGETTKAAVIAAAMSSRFGVGGAAFRLPGAPGTVIEADTVAFAVYRREALEQNGRFDEELVRNQDDEYNFRLRKNGWSLLLAADLEAKYFSRADFRKLWRQYFEYGLYKVRVMQQHPLQMSPRHFVPFLFLVALVFSLVLAPWWHLPLALVAGGWSFAAGLASLQLWQRERWSAGQALLRLPLLPWAFFLLHAAYGAGFAAGLLRFGRHFLGKQT